MWMKIGDKVKINNNVSLDIMHGMTGEVINIHGQKNDEVFVALVSIDSLSLPPLLFYSNEIDLVEDCPTCHEEE
jgi:hypothetical protein